MVHYIVTHALSPKKIKNDTMKIFVIYYMRGRLGLKPEQYAPEEINNIKL